MRFIIKIFLNMLCFYNLHGNPNTNSIGGSFIKFTRVGKLIFSELFMNRKLNSNSSERSEILFSIFLLNIAVFSMKFIVVVVVRVVEHFHIVVHILFVEC